ncbi:LOB domain-containing protein 22 [Phtheirospermum japonicum]|uniref:LOB domain-containing protein 22 n=1 Tax=Phtheirospermum japonicum TaxID=374723 RepID=A0A830D794_9LAMI|nr:LOB domain-containing protein 22 [Phtheirospermum japonicum]
MHTHNNVHNKINIATTTKNNNKNPINPSPTSATTVPRPRSHSSTAQACAACKYRRRKCTSDCILAPYFPYDRQPHFLNAHRLFGVSNIVKIISHLSPPERDLAMRTIIFESDAHAADPVGGCYRIIRDLEQQISLAKAELEIVLHHLAICRAAATQRQVVVPPPNAREYYDEKWREQHVIVEDEVVTVDDVDSWGCTNENLHEHAESTSSSFHYHDHHHDGRRLSMECTNDMITPILDHLVFGDDFIEEEFKFDSHGNITPRFS